MRLVFLGSPEVVIPPLETILTKASALGHELVAVISQPARPVGRKGLLTDPPVAAWAKKQGLRTFQPEKASDPSFLETFRDLRPDLAITAAYGQILTEEFLAVPTRGTINIHPSLLPKLRGATPVPAALLEGCSETGVSVLFTVKKLDAGPLIVQETYPIGPDERADELTDRLFRRGGELVLQTLSKLADPAFTGSPQTEALATFCRKIAKTDGLIDWTLSSDEIYNCFRAYDPWPGSYTFIGGKRVNVVDMRPDLNTLSGLAEGEATFKKEIGAIRVGTGDGTINIAKLKPAGGKEVQAAAFWNGLKNRSHVVFTSAEDGI